MVDWLDRIDADLDNLRAALEWGLEGAPELAMRLAVGLLAYWLTRVMSADDMDRVVAAIGLARALARQPSLTRAQRSLAAQLLGLAAWVWASAGHGAAAAAWGDEAVELAHDGVETPSRIAAHIGRGITGVFAGRPLERLRAELEAAIGEMTEAEDWWTLAIAAGGVASGLAIYDMETSAELLMTATRAAHRTGNPYAIAVTSMAYGEVLGHSGRVEESEARFSEAIARFAELGDLRFVSASQSDLGHVLRRAGRLDEAMAIYRETIGGWVQLGNRGAVANQLENIGFVAIARGDSLRAARLLGAAEALREVVASPMASNEEPEYRTWVERLRAAGPLAVVDAAWVAGRALSMTDAVTEAIGG
jgi:tetratricopeptide (TPR) repeat protein